MSKSCTLVKSRHFWACSSRVLWSVMVLPSCALEGTLWPAMQPHSGRCCAAAQESAALAEAQASNQSLRTQLVEATSAFHHALSIAQTLLIEGASCMAT
jgi:hypothetical protein